jgi:three-Cys-motif partner protein
MPKRNYGRELWDKMVEFARLPDDGPVYECEYWTREKLYFLSNYLAQVTHAIVGNPNFSSVNYVDLFAGSGICSVRCEDNVRRRYPGSALLAAGCAKPFDRLLLIEKEQQKLDALHQRIQRPNSASRISSWLGDANEIIDKVVPAIPHRSLTVAFVDPYSLDVHYNTIAQLAASRPLDLLILFADDIDLIRNVQTYYYPRLDGKLDLFLGSNSNWRDAWDQLVVRDAPRVRQLFADLYLAQLAQLGYGHSDVLPIPRGHRPLYRLVYASKHPLGLKFWRIAASEDVGGNKDLFGIT